MWKDQRQRSSIDGEALTQESPLYKTRGRAEATEACDIVFLLWGRIVGLSNGYFQLILAPVIPAALGRLGSGLNNPNIPKQFYLPLPSDLYLHLISSQRQQLSSCCLTKQNASEIPIILLHCDQQQFIIFSCSDNLTVCLKAWVLSLCLESRLARPHWASALTW